MKRILYYSLILITLLGACSTKKNTRLSRFYHATNTRYNIYYNGKLAYDDALSSMEKGYQENYVEPIFMHAISAQPKDKKNTGGAFDKTIEKSNKAIKLHSIKAKPLKKSGWRNNAKQVLIQSKEEYNPFLKNSWMIMGQAEFYNADFLQASATFSYIAKHFATEPEVVAEAKLWQARCYDEMDWLYESEDILNKLNQKGIPKKNRDQFEFVNAEYLIKDGKFAEAIPHLKLAIKGEPKHLQRSRLKYLLGQLYQGQNQNTEAYKSFGEVIKSSPPYQLEFAARIRQTEVFPGGEYKSIIGKLRSMGRDQKNKDYLDQVFYALGNLYLSRKDTANAIENYQKGIDKSTKNGLDKALCQIKLGDLYFSMRDYVKAQPCFSGALSAINKEFKDYKRVSKISSVLDELVVHVKAVHLQDSLQVLAKMPEKDRLAVIDKIIEKVKKDEEEAKAKADKEAFLADQAAQGTGINRPGTQAASVKIPTAGGSSATFYFYNPQTVADGKMQFQRKWGKRVNEDNWRRRKKELSTFNGNAGAAGQVVSNDTTQQQEAQLDANGKPVAGTEAADSLANDPKSREYYLQQIPMTPEDIDASNVIIIDGMYNMGMIYKDKLEDLPLSIDEFIGLDNRFPDNEHLLETYYQIYLMALRQENEALANEYREKLKAKFPKSDYTIAVSDPDYAYNIRHMDAAQDSIYQITYDRYLASDTATVRKNYREMMKKYPLATLLPKFMFLNALSYVQGGEVDSFKNSLKALVDKYPKADVSELAGEMLKGVLRGRALVQGNVKGMTWNMRFGIGENGQLSAADSARVFRVDSVGENAPYRMLLIYPTGSIDKNQLLFAVAAYNFANSMVKTFDLTFEESGPVSMLQISGFYNLKEILHYYQMIYGKDGYATTFDKSVTIIPISDDNYETLMRGKTLDEYLTFFADKFGDQAPEIVARLKARMAADTNEDKTEDKEPPLPPNIKEEPVEEEKQEEEAAPEVKNSVRRQPADTKTDEKAQKPSKKEKTSKKVTSVKIDSTRVARETMPTITAPAIQVKFPTTVKAIDDTVRLPKQAAIAVPKEDTGFSLKQVLEIRKKQRDEKAQQKADEQKAKQEAAQKRKEEREKLKTEKQQEAAAAQQPQEQAQPKQEAAPQDTTKVTKSKPSKTKQPKAKATAKPKKQVQEKTVEEQSQEDLKKQQAEEEKTLLQQKAEREKQLDQDRKAKMKQAAADRKAKLKARAELQKQKEKEAKQLQKQKEKERKEKAAAYKEKQAEKLKARQEALKAKEAAAKAKRQTK